MTRAGPAVGAGRFEIRGMLGEGGAGVVYRAHDRELGREVALKVLRRASGRDLYRFKREFRALADITHPNLAALYELHEERGEWYFTMELVDGVSFLDWVRPPATGHTLGAPTRGRADIARADLDEARLRAALAQLVGALIAVHAAGQLHRDLKPSNVLVTPAGRVVLLDFGLVLALGDRAPELNAVGTPGYMSPEQAADQPLTPASDWYALGAMLYEALIGERPFEGSPEAVLLRKQSETPTDPAIRVGGLPRDLVKLAMDLLAFEPAARPAGAAILIALGLVGRAITATVGAAATGSAPLVGRDRALAALHAAQADAAARGITVMIRGRAGLGKTALARAFVRSLGDRVLALEGRCYEREAVPFKMLDAVVDRLTVALLALTDDELEAIVPREIGAAVRLFPVLLRVARAAELAAQVPPPSDPQLARRRAFDAVRALLAALARTRPVVVFVDDAQWGDQDSAGLFAELIAAGEPHLMLVFAHRPEDYLGIVARLRRRGGGGRAPAGEIRDVELAPLTDDDARALIARFTAASADPATALELADHADAIVEAAHGNPLVLGELARSPELSPHDLARGTEIREVPTRRDTPIAIIGLVGARAARLSADAQALLAVASVAGRPLPIEIAARAAGIRGGHAEAAELALVRLASVHRSDGETILYPAHDFVRAAVVAQLDADARARCHEAIARAYERAAEASERGARELDAQAVVDHWLAAGHPARAAEYAVPAAAHAEHAFAFRRAAELYATAIAYGAWTLDTERELLRKQARALACAGQLDDAASILARAAELRADADAIDLERLRVEALLRRGRLGDALPIVIRLLAHVGIRVPLEPRASPVQVATRWVQQWRMRGLQYTERDAASIAPAVLRKIDVLHSITSGLAFADPSLGRVLQAELLRAALDAGEPTRVALALVQELCYQATAGSKSRATVETISARLTELASRLHGGAIAGLADTAIGIAAYMGGRWADAYRYLDAGTTRLREGGDGIRWELDIGESYRLGALYYLGRLHELARRHDDLLRDARERGDIAAAQGLCIGRAALSWLARDQPALAREELARAESTMAAGYGLPQALALQAITAIDLYDGRAREASARIDDQWPQVVECGALRIQHVRIELGMLRARCQLADPSRPLADRVRVARASADELAKEGAAWAGAGAQLLRASAAAFAGDLAAAAIALDVADEPVDSAEMTAWARFVRFRRAQLVGDADAIARERDQLVTLGVARPDAYASVVMPWP